MAAISFRHSFLLSVIGFVAIRLLKIGTMEAWVAFFVPILIYLLFGGWKRAYIVFATLPRDVRGARVRIRMLRDFRNFNERVKTVPRKFEQVVRSNPQKACFIFEKKTYTFAEMSELSTAIGIVLRDQLNMKPKETVGLLMSNKPEYVAVWLGAAKVGCITALVNTNVRSDSLIHSLKAANCSAVIFDAEYATAIKEVAAQLDQIGVKHLLQWQPKEADEREASLQARVEKVRKNQEAIRNFTLFDGDAADTLLYIYTSGTTGLPKAAVLRHRRYYQVPAGIAAILLRPGDVVYDPLPLYHSSGGMLGVGLAVLRGHTVVLRAKFSASQYFEDCASYNCTVGQYIGEMCRYLLAQPPRPTDKSHKLRLLVGNGLRQQIWTDFAARFNIPDISEFYGATEGNSQLLNYSNKVGACGFISRVIPMSLGLIKVDRETGAPFRDDTGMCIHCKPGEPGQLVGSVTSGDKTLSDFAGYTDKSATDKKLIKDVFSRGDAAFVTGDILVMDELGFVYFVDRIGDTFRWKGENVSTTEVESVIGDILGVDEDVVVYGVDIPGTEGKAGMAALTSRTSDQVASSPDFARKLAQRLPTYAQPLFIRVVRDVESTGTCKLRKVELKSLGFKPHPNDVHLLMLSPDKKLYEPLTDETYNKLMSGTARL